MLSGVLHRTTPPHISMKAFPAGPPFGSPGVYMSHLDQS